MTTGSSLKSLVSNALLPSHCSWTWLQKQLEWVMPVCEGVQLRQSVLYNARYTITPSPTLTAPTSLNLDPLSWPRRLIPTSILSRFRRQVMSRPFLPTCTPLAIMQDTIKQWCVFCQKSQQSPSSSLALQQDENRNVLDSIEEDSVVGIDISSNYKPAYKCIDIGVRIEQM